MNMQRIRQTLVTLISCYFVLYGCGGGGGTIDLDSQARASLIGTWKLVQAGQPGVQAASCPGIFQFGTGAAIVCGDNTTITLNQDGSFRAFDGTTGTWSVSNGGLTATSGQNSVSGQLEFQDAATVIVRDSQGRFLKFQKVA
jgi:hypothetical protein